MSLRILIVEDEPDIREAVQASLLSEGFSVTALDNGSDVLPTMRQSKPDIVLLDQILPGKTGVEVVRELRAEQQFARTPIMMVTGLAGEDDKVLALDIGADDYLTKPFSMKELSARIKALARRAEIDAKQDRLQKDRLVVDFAAHRVTMDGGEVQLTLTEFKILAELLKQSGTVLTRERLRERALGNLNVTDRTIDVHMASLRKKLTDIGDKIETVRGVGYRFAD
jgi:two-component system, OmpR family, phosphate regulon response regulator PhoB